MTTALMPEGRQRYFNNDGTPAAGGKLYLYAAGTTNPKTAYQDAAGTIAHPNPVPLDAKGEAVIYWDGAYKVDLKQADGLQVTGYPVDNLKTDPAGLWTLLATVASALGATLIGFIQAGAGAVLRTLESKARESVSVLDFIPVAEHAAIAARASNYDCLAAFNKAFAVAKRVRVTEGRFPLSGTLTIPAQGLLSGSGRSSDLYGVNVVGPLLQMGPDGVATEGCRAENLNLSGTATTGMSLNNCQGCTAENITLGGGTFTDGFSFVSTFPGHFKSLMTNGAVIANACFKFGNEVNACVFDNLYTSNICPHNFYWSGTGHGNTFNTPSAQGGRYGFNIAQMFGFGSMVVNSLYTENTVHPIQLNGAYCVTFNGGTLAGPETTHPYYGECVAAINLLNANGCTFNSVHFIGTSQSGGGYPTVTIGGDGGGAAALARVKPTGEIHSIEILNGGTGYTQAAATAAIAGGGGAGATLAVTVTAGAITGIAVTAPGAGYKRAQTPMAISYTEAYSCSFNDCIGYVAHPGNNGPFYPLLVRNAGAGFASTMLLNDVSLRGHTYGVKAAIRTAGGANFTMSIREDEWDGTALFSAYKIPQYP